MNKTLVGSIVVILVVAGAVFFMNNKADAPTDSQNEVVPSPTPAPAPSQNPSSTQPKTYDVSMTDSAYAPNTLTIKKGDTVKFTNNGTKANWPASAPHPTHTDYPEFDPKVGVAVGQSWSFTFEKTGVWRYHDHLNPTRFGTITVTE